MGIQITETGAGYFQFKTQLEPDSTFVLSQMDNIIDYFEKFLIKEQFDVLVEIGTYKGGLTILLDEIKQSHKLKTAIHTLDVTIWDEQVFISTQEAFANRKIVFKKIDIFSKAGIKYVSTLLKDSKKKVCVMCDGGNKIEEFKIFSKMLKQGDFIMAHDYHHNCTEERSKHYDCSWSWQEILYTDIEESVKENKLEMNTDIDFPNVAWACYKKV